ncbi:MAG: transporter [Thermoprotei archaeon]|nr:MAG: transporter [Thermoprotei archaeon]
MKGLAVLSLSPLIFALLSVLLGALGQVLWKYGLSLMEFSPEMFFNLKGLIKIVSNGWIPAGILCYFFSMTLWLKALKEAELSYVYPLISLNFVILTVVGVLLFHENVTWLRVLGILLIISGIVMVAQS